MKKLVCVLLIAAGLVAAGDLKAQTKIGYIGMEELIVLMPEFKKADSALQEYQEALGEQYNDMIRDLNAQDSILSGPDTAKYTRAQLDIKRKQLGELYMKIQGFQNQSQQMMQQKQEELLAPVQRKAMETVQAVAKESGYTYVMRKEAVLVGPPADDLLPLVKKKLNLK
jgi:outer membrane protein